MCNPNTQINMQIYVKNYVRNLKNTAFIHNERIANLYITIYMYMYIKLNEFMHQNHI